MSTATLPYPTLVRLSTPWVLFSSALTLGAPPLVVFGRGTVGVIVSILLLAVIAAWFGVRTTRMGVHHHTAGTTAGPLGIVVGALAAAVGAGVCIGALTRGPEMFGVTMLLETAWAAGLVRERNRTPVAPPTNPEPSAPETRPLPGETFGKNAEHRLVLLMRFDGLAATMKDAINTTADQHIDAFKERVEWASLDLKTRGLVEGVLRLAKMIMPRSLTDEFAKPLTQSGYQGTQTTYTANLQPHDKEELARIRASMDPLNARTGKLKEELKRELSPDMSEAEAARRFRDVHLKHGFATADDYLQLYTQRLEGYRKTSEYMQMVAHRPEEEAADAMPSDNLVSPVEKLIQKIFEQLPPVVQRELPIFIADLSLALVDLRYELAVPHIRTRLEHLLAPPTAA